MKKTNLNVQIVFLSKDKECYKLLVDLNKIRLDEILICINKQYPTK